MSKLSKYLIDIEEAEKEFESDLERFYYGLSDEDLNFILDCKDRAIDMSKE